MTTVKRPIEHPEDTQLDRVERILNGNGQEGLVGRTARVEEKVIAIANAVDEVKNSAATASDKAEVAVTKVAESLNELTINVIQLADSVKAHIGTDHLSVLMKKKSFWLLIVVGLIAMHMISTYVPNVWDAGMLLLGLPKLVLPPPAG